MISDPLRRHIDAVRQLPGGETALRERLGQLPGIATVEKVRDCEQALNNAIDSIPGIIEQMSIAGQQAGIGHLLAPILQQMTSYFLAGDDLVPDREGTIGLLDDAYLAHLYLQEINRAYQANTGVLLVAVDLSPTIGVLRSIMGPAISARLDAVVAEGVSKAVQQSQFEQLTQWSQPLSATGGAGAWGGSWEDEMSRVGAEIGISIDW